MEQLFPRYKKIADPLEIYDDLDLKPHDANRPYIAMNMVSSVDGKITLAGTHQTQKLGSWVDRGLMIRLRRHFDAVLRGAETVRANPYFPSADEGKTDEHQDGKGESKDELKQPIPVTVSGSLDLPIESAFFSKRGIKPIVFTSASSDPGKRDRLADHAHVEIAGEERIDFSQLVQKLFDEYGVGRLLVEGGATLNYWFIKEGLIDEVFWTLAPKLSGFGDDLTMIEGPELFQPTPRLKLVTLYHHENELYFRWSARDVGSLTDH